MAKLKDEYKKPEEDFMTRMRRENAKFEKEHPILDTRYWIEEWDKGFSNNGGWDQDIPASHKGSWKYFKTMDEVNDWLEKHEPDKNCEFKVRVEHLRHYSYDKWGR